jgi:hypothetical protein
MRFQAGLRGNFDKALAKKGLRSDDLAAGRQYVEVYVEYVHYVERTCEASTMSAQGHYREPGESWEEAGARRALTSEPMSARPSPVLELCHSVTESGL